MSGGIQPHPLVKRIRTEGLAERAGRFCPTTVTVAALMGKASPPEALQLCPSRQGKVSLECDSSVQVGKKRHPVSQEPRNTTKSHPTTNPIQETYWERNPRRVALMRSSGELSRREGLYRMSWGWWGGVGPRAFRDGLGWEELCGLTLKLRNW